MYICQIPVSSPGRAKKIYCIYIQRRLPKGYDLENPRVHEKMFGGQDAPFKIHDKMRFTGSSYYCQASRFLVCAFYHVLNLSFLRQYDKNWHLFACMSDFKYSLRPREND